METNEEFTPEEQAEIKAYETGKDIAPESVVDKAVEIKEEPKEEPKKEEVRTPEGFVPHGALHEERARRKELQKELQEYREKFSRVDERLKMLTEKPESTQVSFDEDPLGYSKSEIERLRGGLDQVSKQYPESIQKLQGEIETLRAQRTVEKLESEFSKQNPDYNEAISFYAKNRIETMTELGYDEEEAKNIMASELRDAVTRSMQNGKNPAQVVYGMAKRSGFNGKTKDTGQIDTLKKADTASRSLSDTSGKSNTGLTAEALAEMSEEEFSAISKSDWKKLAGG